MLNGQYITVEEASWQLGITEQGVRAKLRKGHLEASKQRGVWFICVSTRNGLVLPVEAPPQWHTPNAWRV